MGGEPLLHPEAASFLRATRDHFPRARVSFVTNGILLPQAPPEFWEACRATRTIIGMTVYPPVRGRVAHVRSLCEVRGVELSTTDREIFYAHLNFKGDSRPGPTFARCRARDYCPFLQDGRLYVCATPALVGYFNQRFHSRIAADAGIDIHAPGASGRAILRQLDQPVETCKWCSDDPVSFPWTTSSRRPEEWEAATYRAAGP